MLLQLNWCCLFQVTDQTKMEMPFHRNFAILKVGNLAIFRVRDASACSGLHLHGDASRRCGSFDGTSRQYRRRKFVEVLTAVVHLNEMHIFIDAALRKHYSVDGHTMVGGYCSSKWL